jgi:glycosyltransferase involved in cell wall biosynthesis
VSIGNFLHGPNRDAVQYLKSTIWPLIRARLPKAELRVYGAYPDTASQNFHNKKEGFLVMGRAESAVEVMSAARICLAPLRYGAGQKGKLVLAMECGTPSLTTHVGAEAMYDTPSWPGFLSDDPLAFAEAAVKYYSDVSAWSQARDTAKRLLNSFYSPQNHLPRFHEKITLLLSDLPAHRLNNFTGFMLQQNERQSTRYMALWIESKNKSTDTNA